MPLPAPPPPRIPAGRWTLRLMAPPDWRIEQLLSEEPTVPRWTPYPPRLTEREARARVRTRIRQSLRGAAYQYVIEGSGADALGIAILLDEPGGAVEIGYALTPAGRGKGAAAAATRALVDWAFRAGCIEARLTIMAGNDASTRVARATGFRRVERRSASHQGRAVAVDIWSRRPRAGQGPDRAVPVPRASLSTTAAT